MRLCLLLALILLALCPALVSAEPAPRSVYIVSLSDPPLATYAGGLRAKDGRVLTPTSPAATGALRLDMAAPAAQAYLAHLERSQQLLLDQATTLAKRALAPRFFYRYASNGFALELSAVEAAELRALPGVAAVEPEIVERPLTDRGAAWIGAASIWAGAVPGIAASRGEGTIIGIIDTGINWNHPAFAPQAGDGFVHANPVGRLFGLCNFNPSRCNAKLIGIHDFTDEGPRDGGDANGHGSHVAAIAAGNPVAGSVGSASAPIAVNVSGVAPRAAIISYKACQRDTSGQSPSGTCPGSATLAAIDQAVRDGVAVINYSIGGAPRDPWAEIRSNGSSSTRALLAARAAGILPAVAAGNDGPNRGTVTSPGNAPWALAVANATDDLVFGTKLGELSGPGVEAGSALQGASLVGAVGVREIVYAGDFGNALCGSGATQGVNPDGASNPFAPGTFNGQIVVCERGVYARVEKGFNVRAAGAAGYVLTNVASDAESIVADVHFLPATHLGFADAERLRGWLAQARSAGQPLRGSIGSVLRIADARFGDLLNVSSGRGPVQPFGGWLKPNLTAPGTNILAAAGSGAGLASLTGTSMASPHVAGAALLLRALRPSWRVDQIESALLTTALDTVRASNGARAADPHEAGGGRAWLPEAARAGLYFANLQAEFVGADPLAAGPLGPTRLNHPSLSNPDCLGSCSFDRRVTDMAGGGTWRVVARLPDGALLSAVPATFTLANGGTQALTFALDVNDARVAGQWVYGAVELVNDASAVTQRLTVAVRASAGNIPPRVPVPVSITNGFADLDFSGVVALRDAAFKTRPMVRMTRFEAEVAADPTPTDPWDNPLAHNWVRLIELRGDPRGPLLASLIVDSRTLTAPRVDLYVGRDNNGDGIPQASEQLCVQAGAGSNKRCQIELLLNGAGDAPRYWLMVQNRVAGFGGRDQVTLAFAAPVQDGPEALRDPSFVASGPGQVPAGAPFNVRIGWTQPTMQAGDRWLGWLELIGARNRAPLGRSLIEFNVDAAMALAPQVLDGDGVPLALVLNPGIEHEQIVLDVPANATRVVFEASGPDAGAIDLYAAPDASASMDPNVMRAPPASAAVASIGGLANPKRLEIGANRLTPGRWYVVPRARGSAPAAFSLRATVETTGAPPPLRDGLYMNFARTNTGWFLNRAGDLMALAWYTFDEARQPVWYIAIAPGASGPVWRSPLMRYVRGIEADIGHPVGEVVLTRTSAQRARVAWRLDGRWGSEPLTELALPRCQVIDGIDAEFTGNWYQLLDRGFGLNTFTQGGVEAYVPYVYDERGNPRWVIAVADLPNNGVIALQQFNGQCPDCAFAPGNGVVVGSLTRSFSSPRLGRGRFALQLAAPLIGGANTDAPIARLTDDLPCGR